MSTLLNCFTFHVCLCVCICAYMPEPMYHIAFSCMAKLKCFRMTYVLECMTAASMCTILIFIFSLSHFMALSPFQLCCKLHWSQVFYFYATFPFSVHRFPSLAYTHSHTLTHTHHLFTYQQQSYLHGRKLFEMMVLHRILHSDNDLLIAR